MSDRPRSRRRLVLVAVTVSAIAGAGVAGSLVLPAEASPTPVTPALDRGHAAPEAPGALSGAPARSIDGSLGYAPVAAARGATGVLLTSGFADTSAQAAELAPGTTFKPPAVTPVTGTDVVVSATPGITYSPDGSRVVFGFGSQLVNSHLDGSGAFYAGQASAVSQTAWSPYGRFLALMTAGNPAVITAAGSRAIPIQTRPRGVPLTVSWSGPAELLEVLRIRGGSNTFVATVPLFGNTSDILYTSSESETIVDAVGSPDSSKTAIRTRTTAADRTTTESIVVLDAGTGGAKRTVLTTTGSFGRPAWSRDSSTVYVPRTEGGVTALVSHAATDTAGDPVVLVPDLRGKTNVYLRPRPAGPALGRRPSGRDSIATAVNASKIMYALSQGRSCEQLGAATTAVVARVNSVEATIGGPLAEHTCGPLLLTGAKSLDSRTAAELKRLLTRGRTVYVVGNTASLSATVATQIARLGYKVVRYGGKDTADTAVQVALRGWKKHDYAAIASGTQPLAAVVATSTAGESDVPLLLTNGTRMPASTLAFVTKYRTRAWVVGSQGAAAAPWAYKYVGSTDLATSMAVATRYYYPPYLAALVSASAVNDAYASSGWVASFGIPVLVVAPASLPSTVRTYLDQVSGSLNGVSLWAPTKNVSSKVLTDATTLARGRW